jgi:hypothetical protein
MSATKQKEKISTDVMEESRPDPIGQNAREKA